MRKKVWMYIVPVLLVVTWIWAVPIVLVAKMSMKLSGPVDPAKVLLDVGAWLLVPFILSWAAVRMLGRFSIRRGRYKSGFAMYETASLVGACFMGACAAIAASYNGFVEWLIWSLLWFVWMTYEKRGFSRWKRRLGLTGVAAAAFGILFFLSRA